MTIPELVDFYGSRGFGCIAITDHLCEESHLLGKVATYLNRTLTRATFPLYMEIIKSEARRAWNAYGMLVLTGVELTKNSLSNHRSAHILGIGIDSYIPADLDVVEIVREIRRQGGLAVAAHPVSTREFEPQTYHLWGQRERLALEFDAWEVASGPHIFDEVLQSGLPMLASSDLHHARQIHAWKTAFHCARTREAVFTAVREQDLKFQFYKEVATDHDSRGLVGAPVWLGLGSGVGADVLGHSPGLAALYQKWCAPWKPVPLSQRLGS